MNCEINISGICLKCGEITLREFKPGDLQDLFQFASQPGLGEMAGWHHHESLEDSASLLNYYIKTKKTFALEFGGRVIGSLGLQRYEERRFPELSNYLGRELSFALHRDFHNRGIMTQAVGELCRWLFEDLGFDFALIGCYEENLPSRRVAEKCGFEFYKRAETINQMGQRREAMFYLRKRLCKLK